MNQVLDTVGVAFVGVGLLFIIIGSVGIVRLPDFFSRTHAASKVDTVGVVIVSLGIACIEGFSIVGLKVLLIGLFVTLTNPVSSHALARAAFRSGLKPWSRSDSNPQKEN